MTDHNIVRLAELYGIDDPTDLFKQLTEIKERYAVAERRQDHFPSEKQFEKLIADIRTHASRLSRLLEHSERSLKMQFDQFCVRREIADPDGVDEPLLVGYGRGFTDDLVHRLNALQDVAFGWHVMRRGHKPMWHRNGLLRDLRRCWTSLTGRNPDYSTRSDSFRTFMEDACQYMEIDPRGLWNRHQRFPPKRA